MLGVEVGVRHWRTVLGDPAMCEPFPARSLLSWALFLPKWLCQLTLLILTLCSWILRRANLIRDITGAAYGAIFVL